MHELLAIALTPRSYTIDLSSCRPGGAMGIAALAESRPFDDDVGLVKSRCYERLIDGKLKAPYPPHQTRGTR